jgi:hypothetical protein
MARVNLIEGERLARQGTFVDVAKAVEPAFEAAELRIAQDKAEVAAAEQKTATYLGKMKSNIDLSKFSDAQTKVVQKFAGEQKEKYLAAAKALGTMKSTDPGYMEQVDIMNDVNNSFVNLDANMKGYIKDRVQYNEDFNAGTISKGDPDKYVQASNLYDPSAVFNVSSSGNMSFGDNENAINYSDWSPPGAIAHSQATAILNKGKEAYSNSLDSGSEMNEESTAVLKSQLREILGKDPSVIKSLSNDNLLSDYEEDLPEYSGKPEDFQAWKDSYIDKIVKGVKASSAKGASEYKVKNDKKNPATYRGYSKTALKQQFDSKGNITKGETVYKYVAMPKGEFKFADGKYTYADGKAVSNVVKRELEKIDAIQGAEGAAATFTPENPFKPGYMAINLKDNTYQNNFLTDPMELAPILVTKTNN